MASPAPLWTTGVSCPACHVSIACGGRVLGPVDVALGASQIASREDLAGAVLDGGARLPSAAMLRLAQALAHERRIECPEEVKSDLTACRKFLDEQAPERTPGKRGRSKCIATKGRSTSPVPTDRIDPPEDGSQKADGSMIGFAQSLAQKRGLKIPPGVPNSFQQCRAVLDRYSRPRSKGEVCDLDARIQLLTVGRTGGPASAGGPDS
jgi:hypothetical protein